MAQTTAVPAPVPEPGGNEEEAWIAIFTAILGGVTTALGEATIEYAARQADLGLEEWRSRYG